MLGFLKGALGQFGCPDSRALVGCSSGLCHLSLSLGSETYCLGDTWESIYPPVPQFPHL